MAKIVETSIYKGGSKIKDCYIGDTPVKAIYKGSTLIYDVCTRTISVLSFQYNSGQDIGVGGNTQDLYPTSLIVRVTEQWSSGRQGTSTDYDMLDPSSKPTWLNVFYTSTTGHVEGTTGLLEDVDPITTLKARTLIDTVTVSVQDSYSTTGTGSYAVYQQANAVENYYATSTSYSVGNTETTVRLNAYGVLTSGNNINLTSATTWTESSGLVVFEGQYATIPENSGSARSFSIQAEYSTYRRWINIEQAAGSGWGNLTITFPFTLTQNDMYMKLLGTGIGYAHGTRISGQNKIVFKGNELARWNEFEGNTNRYGYFLSQSPSSDTGYYNSIGRSHYQSLQAGEPLSYTARTDDL